MKTTTLLTLAFFTASSALALAQSSGGGAGGGAAGGSAAGATGTGTSGTAPGSVPSGTGGTGSINTGGAGIPGGAGPGDTTTYPNQPAMRPNNPTVGHGPGGSFGAPSGSGLNSSPSSLSNPGVSGNTDPTAPPAGAPRIMVPERR